MENDKGKLVWDFEFILSEETISRNPDLIWREKERKNTRVCDMAYPRRRKRRKKKNGKQTTSRNVVFELRERRPSGGVEEAIREIEIFENNFSCKKIGINFVVRGAS